MQVTQVTIVKSTAKAHLVADTTGRQGWVQNRSLKADSTVNTTTFDKAAAEFTGRVQAKADAAAFANEFHSIGLVQRETEKDVAVQADWSEECSDQAGKATIWFPKSQLVDGQAKGWLIEAKARELRERLTRMSVTFEIAIGNNTFWM